MSTVTTVAISSAQTGSLSVRLFDETGAEIHEGEIKLSALNPDAGDKVAGWKLKPAESATVPFGDYRVEAFVDGFHVERGVVRIAQPALTSRLVLRLGIDPAELAGARSVTNRVVGKVEPYSAAKSGQWVKLVALGSRTQAGGHEINFVTDVTVSGEFELAGMDNGSYLLLLLAFEPKGSQSAPHVIKSLPVDLKSGVVNIKFAIDGERPN